MHPILEVNNLRTHLKIEQETFPVVRDVSFTLHAGETLALVGETGCGKSMTALSIMGIAPRPPTLPSTGEVLYKGNNLLEYSPSQMRRIRGRHLAMIFQDPKSALNPLLTIGDQLLEMSQTHETLTPAQAHARALELLAEVQLSAQVMVQYPHQLSGGMLQRAMIAMALMCNPDLLIADEPTTALDVTVQKQILELLKELQQRHGMAILLITHDMNVVAMLAHRMIVLYAGEMIEQGTTQEILSRPAHPYTQALLAARPMRPIREGLLPALEGQVPSLNQLPSGCPFHPRCRYRMPECRQVASPLFPLPSPTHGAKCWLFDPTLAWRVDVDSTF